MKFIKNHQEPFVYSSNGEKYVAYYETITSAQDKQPWLVVIITPVKDITVPLRKGTYIAILLISITLLIGIILASIFSSSLSRPIKKLAQDANLICQLQLSEVKEVYSRILEITKMATSFNHMKNALESFQLYMPVALVKKLIESNKIATVGGETKELSLLFTDIRDFTQLSEKIKPQELMQYLSRYFQTITKVIVDNNGTVDKYIGDGSMAFWGAPIDDPNHAYNACQAALQIQRVLAQLNKEWQLQNKPTLKTRIGINTGNTVVGNVGSDDRLNYTALGDAVNVASRLERLNKQYETFILVGALTHAKVKDKFAFRLVDKVATKGKTQGTYVYELMEELKSSPISDLQQYNQEFGIAFAYYEKGDWQNALGLFETLAKKYPDDKLIKLFIRRCTTFAANPPPHWNGVWVMTEK